MTANLKLSYTSVKAERISKNVFIKCSYARTFFIASMVTGLLLEEEWSRSDK